MKIKSGFILRDVGGKTFVVAVGDRSREFKGMITLNETGKIIWQTLQNESNIEDVVNALMDVCVDADREVVEADVKVFVEKLAKDGILE